MFTVAMFCAEFPALSTAVPVTCCPAPSVAKATGSVQLAVPDKASLHWKATVTAALFQPLALGAGVCVWLINGFVLSMRTTAVRCDSTLPALSTLQNSSACSPSPVTLTVVPSCTAPPSRM